MPLTAQFNLSLTGKQTSALDLGTGTFPFAISLAVALASGTGADQADRIFSDTRTLGASATEDLDLAASLTDAFGASITFVKVKAVVITAAAANTNDVNVTRPAANGLPLFLAASDGIPVRPKGAFVWFAPGTGITVTPGTGDLLTLTNSAGGTGVTYSVVIIGTSA
jgi:hypothetical protein